MHPGIPVLLPRNTSVQALPFSRTVSLPPRFIRSVGIPRNSMSLDLFSGAAAHSVILIPRSQDVWSSHPFIPTAFSSHRSFPVSTPYFKFPAMQECQHVPTYHLLLLFNIHQVSCGFLTLLWFSSLSCFQFSSWLRKFYFIGKNWNLLLFYILSLF